MRIVCAVDGSEYAQWGVQALQALANERVSRSSADAALRQLAEDRLRAAQEENTELRKRLGISAETDLRLR